VSPHRVVASVDVIAHKKVVRVGRLAADAEELHQVVELAATNERKGGREGGRKGRKARVTTMVRPEGGARRSALSLPPSFPPSLSQHPPTSTPTATPMGTLRHTYLPVDVPANGDRALNRLHVTLVGQDLLGLRG